MFSPKDFCLFIGKPGKLPLAITQDADQVCNACDCGDQVKFSAALEEVHGTADCSCAFANNMDEFITEALKEDLSELTEPVITVLQAAKWTQRMLSNPDMKQDLVVVLKEPWLYFDEKGKMPYGLEQLTRENAAEVHNAAIAIAATLVLKQDNRITFNGALFEGSGKLLFRI